MKKLAPQVGLEPTSLRLTKGEAAVADRLWTPKDLAEYLAVKPVTVYEWVKRRRVPHILLSAGKRKETVRFRRQDIDRWLKQRERGGKNVSKWDLR